MEKLLATPVRRGFKLPATCFQPDPYHHEKNATNISFIVTLVQGSMATGVAGQARLGYGFQPFKPMLVVVHIHRKVTKGVDACNN